MKWQICNYLKPTADYILFIYFCILCICDQAKPNAVETYIDIVHKKIQQPEDYPMRPRSLADFKN